MNTKEKGDKSVGAVLGRLSKLGKPVLLPFGDSQRYDLVVDENDKFVRVQCKTGRLKKGSICFDARSYEPNKSKGNQRHYI